MNIISITVFEQDSVVKQNKVSNDSIVRLLYPIKLPVAVINCSSFKIIRLEIEKYEDVSKHKIKLDKKLCCS